MLDDERYEVQRDFARGVRDWLPVVAILVAYLVLHELGKTLQKVAHVDPNSASTSGWAQGPRRPCAFSARCGIPAIRTGTTTPRGSST